LLDSEVDSGFPRAGERGELERFESEPREFFQQVRSADLQRAHAEPNRFVIIDAAPPIPNVQNAIAQALEKIIHHA